MDDGLFRAAAEAIGSADVLLLHLGAGMSADSGLAVFVDVATVPVYVERAHSCRRQRGCPTASTRCYGFWGIVVQQPSPGGAA